MIPGSMHKILQKKDVSDRLADDLGEMHIKITQKVVWLVSFSNHALEKRAQIVGLMAYHLHTPDQTGLTDGYPQAVSFDAQALPVENAWKGFILHQNLGNFLTTVRHPLERRLGLLPYAARHIVDKCSGNCPTKGRQQASAVVG